MADLPHGPHRTRRSTETLSPQTLRENETLHKRIRACGLVYPEVSSRLEDYATRSGIKLTHNMLMRLAGQMIATVGSPQVDRVARRHKAGAICWFCENMGALTRMLNRNEWPAGLESPPAAVPPPQMLVAAPVQHQAAPTVPLGEPQPEPEDAVLTAIRWETEKIDDPFRWFDW
jgi:hypothetical protein